MQDTTRYTLVIGITAVTACAELVGAHTTHSTGLLSDALHLLGDSMPFVVGFWLVWGMLPLEEEVEGVFETLIVIFNTLFLAGAALFLTYRGISRLLFPVEIEPDVMWFALFGLVGNAAQLYFAWGLHSAHAHSGTYRSQILHLSADLAASIAVVVAAYLVVTTGYQKADSIASLLVAVITAWAAWQCSTNLLKNTEHSEHHAHDHHRHHH